MIISTSILNGHWPVNQNQCEHFNLFHFFTKLPIYYIGFINIMLHRYLHKKQLKYELQFEYIETENLFDK